jgi:hypothetical protein
MLTSGRNDGGETMSDQEQRDTSLEEEVERLLVADSEFVERVVTLYEASERNYRAAMTAGTVVHGASASTNF